MLTLCYAGRSSPSAFKIADESVDIGVRRGNLGDINWGRARANARLNPDISNVTNKRVMRELFAEHDVPMPKLVDPLFDYEVSYPIVGRPDRHTKKRGFWLCRNERDVLKAVRGTKRKKPATHFMEFITAPHEYRVHIVCGKSIRISEKLFDETGDYTTIKPTGNVKHVRKAAKQALEAVGLDFGAVDILASDSEAFVLEVNAAPGLGGSMPRLYARTFLSWAEGEI